MDHPDVTEWTHNPENIHIESWEEPAMAPLLHVRIVNDGGREVADVDAESTLDALAYWLSTNRARHANPVRHSEAELYLIIGQAHAGPGGRVGLTAAQPVEYAGYRAEVH